MIAREALGTTAAASESRAEFVGAEVDVEGEARPS